MGASRLTGNAAMPAAEVRTWLRIRDGQPFSVALSVFMLQAIDHGKEHRTHVAASLTELGIEPPDLDGWAWDERV